MNRRYNASISVILIIFLVTLLFVGSNVGASAPDAGVWSDRITHPAAIRLIEQNPTPTSTPLPIGEQVVNTARQYLGTPYVWGGTTPAGFDCSGLVQYIYKQIGINVSRTTITQVNEGRAVSRDELKAGDLVFFANSGGVHHVGIYMGGGRFIHAPYTGEVVKITNLSERNDYYCARRIVE